MAAPLEFVLPFILVGALLYTSVGHGGATVYLAILTLAGFTVDPLVTTILVLNVLAAGIGFLRFTHAGHLRPQLLWPFLVTSVPLAYLGGLVVLPALVRSQILGALLLLAAARFLFVQRVTENESPASGWRFYMIAAAVGGALGFAAGATGIGGGIFLSPVLLVLGWANVRESAAVAAAFIVVNSLAGLAARLPRTPLDPGVLLPLAAVILIGAFVGSYLGAARLPKRWLQAALGVVLVVAGAKALFV